MDRRDVLGYGLAILSLVVGVVPYLFMAQGVVLPPVLLWTLSLAAVVGFGGAAWLIVTGFALGPWVAYSVALVCSGFLAAMFVVFPSKSTNRVRQGEHVYLAVDPDGGISEWRVSKIDRLVPSEQEALKRIRPSVWEWYVREKGGMVHEARLLSPPSVLRGAAVTLIDEGERYIATMATSAFGSPESKTAFASWKKRAGEFLNAVDIYEIADRDWHRATSAIEQAGRLVAALKDIRDRTH